MNAADSSSSSSSSSAGISLGGVLEPWGRGTNPHRIHQGTLTIDKHHQSLNQYPPSPTSGSITASLDVPRARPKGGMQSVRIAKHKLQKKYKERARHYGMKAAALPPHVQMCLLRQNISVAYSLPPQKVSRNVVALLSFRRQTLACSLSHPYPYTYTFFFVLPSLFPSIHLSPQRHTH